MLPFMVILAAFAINVAYMELTRCNSALPAIRPRRPR